MLGTQKLQCQVIFWGLKPITRERWLGETQLSLWFCDRWRVPNSWFWLLALSSAVDLLAKSVAVSLWALHQQASHQRLAINGFVVTDPLTREQIWLVVWNILDIFPYIGNFIIPIDFHIFQRGRAQPPTRWSESWKIPGPSGIQGASTHGEPPAVAPMPRKKETPVPYLPMDQHVSDVQLLQAQSGCCYWAVEGSDVWHFYGIYV